MAAATTRENGESNNMKEEPLQQITTKRSWRNGETANESNGISVSAAYAQWRSMKSGEKTALAVS